MTGREKEKKNLRLEGTHSLPKYICEPRLRWLKNQPKK